VAAFFKVFKHKFPRYCICLGVGIILAFCLPPYFLLFVAAVALIILGIMKK